ncbi:hypothetical protein [Dyadobacter sp. CY323]|uniref:hypothetical protein n=1 Tax=Dyadobacter sp. CY323 TaxID=2907302 RepID=UPI001F2BFD9A|nr:hypothetical protein [Dyadobacter sp. CY323]MCE6992493.1 hypothetical protein [Dyadobacter sp. CY323]
MIEIKSRRVFLQKCCSLGITGAGIVMLAGCGSSKTTTSKVTSKTNAKPAANNPCDDLTGVDPVDVEKRKSLGYVNLSPVPDKQCDACKLWVPAAEGKECGGCLLFAGPVAPEGNCTYWAPQV